MKQQSFLPNGWGQKVFFAVCTALLGNLVLRILPLSPALVENYKQSGNIFTVFDTSALVLTLFLAPLTEEAIFRLGIYGGVRRIAGKIPAALFSSLAFGIYHGNWIQGIYAFILGIVLAWGYESSSFGKYRMAVLMHAAANAAVILVFAGG